MNAETNSPLLNKLYQADKWLRDELRLVGPDRIRKGIDLVKEIKSASRADALARYFATPDRAEKILTYIEIVEFAEAFDFIRKCYGIWRRVVRNKMQNIVNGPQLITEESTDDNSNEARNKMFEFVLGARFDMVGLSVELCEPDLEILINSRRYLVACKRPFGAETVQRNIQDAEKQIIRNMDKRSDNPLGIIAISATRSINLLGLGIPVNLDSAMKGMASRLNGLALSHVPVLNSIQDSRVVAALFHLSAPAISQLGGLSPAQIIVEHAIPGKEHIDGELLRLMQVAKY